MDGYQKPYPEIHFGSPEWKEIKDWLLAEKREIISRLANKQTSWDDTLYLRGQASIIDRMLEFEELAAPVIYEMPR